MRQLRALLLLTTMGFTPWLGAAIQGEAGERESTAVTTITLNIAPSLQITNVSDIVLEVTDRTQDVIFEERICVRGNLGGRYNVVAAAQDGSQSPFQLQSVAGDESVDYELFFRGDLSQTTLDQLLPGESSPFYSMQSQAPDCEGDDTAAFTIVFRSNELLAAQPGVYAGSLTLTVAAE